MISRQRLYLHRYPTLAALCGIVAGALLYCLMPREALLGFLPIPTLKGGVFPALMAGFYKEGFPLCLALLFYRVTRHPLPILLAVTWRAFCFALSALHTAASASLPFFLVYLALHTATLIAHIAAGIAALTKTKQTGLFPFLYFMGLILLLTTIRLLTFTLLL